MAPCWGELARCNTIPLRRWRRRRLRSLTLCIFVPHAPAAFLAVFQLLANILQWCRTSAATTMLLNGAVREPAFIIVMLFLPVMMVIIVVVIIILVLILLDGDNERGSVWCTRKTQRAPASPA